MELEIIEKSFNICKVKSLEQIDFSREYVFLSKTPDEISLVCEADYTPPGVIITESDWKALRVSGVLDFDMIGVIAKITNILTDEKVSIFVISTYNTDYILIKEKDFDKGIRALLQSGCVINVPVPFNSTAH